MDTMSGQNRSIPPYGEGAARKRLYEIIFEADTPPGKAFDVVLILSIVLSVAAVMIDSMRGVRESHGALLYAIEWFFTGLFTIEYGFRLYCVRNTFHYAFSFFGIVDLLAIVPTYLSLFFPGSQYLIVIRVLRVLRVFRVLKIVQYLGEADLLMQAMRSSRRKVIVFLLTVLTLVVILGSLMYLIEGEENGFTSIPRSTYWAIVTLTTVGYGDISPKTSAGQALAAVVMILGYAIIAVPTGIVTVELSNVSRARAAARVCPGCGVARHDLDATYCKHCGSKLA